MHIPNVFFFFVLSPLFFFFFVVAEDLSTLKNQRYGARGQEAIRIKLFEWHFVIAVVAGGQTGTRPLFQ